MHQGKKPQEPWVNMCKGSSLATKGKALSYVAPVCTNGKVIAHLQQDEVDKCTTQWMNVFVMFAGGNPNG